MTGLWDLLALVTGARLKALRASHAKAADRLDQAVRDVTR